MFTNLRARFVIAALLLASAPALAGVTVQLNTGPGATSWPPTPISSSVSNPAAQATVVENFASGGGSTSYGQTFTVPAGSNRTLQSIFLYAGGGTGTSGSAPVRLNLYDLGATAAPNPGSYPAGTNLFGAGAGLAITYTPQSNGVLRLNFTGSDQVVLVAGRLYAFEIAGTAGTSPINWLRSTSNTYPGGAAYRNRAWINANNARDFALAVYATTQPPVQADITVNAAVSRQLIDGFGAGAVFLDAGLNPLSDAQMNTLYGTGAGQLGLTLLRVRISPSGNFSDALVVGQRAVARGARILATPWTPPASMKSNNSLTNGGTLLPSAYDDYVAHLNGFLDTMAANGAPVSVISIQNEPDWAPDYESATWTAEQFRVFARDFAGDINAPVMMPESLRFDQALSNATLNDPAAAANVDFIGGHLYGVTTISDYPLARNLGKRLWQTEYLVNDQSIASALNTAVQINDCLTVGNMSAYIWWKTIGNANGLLNASGVAQKRGFVMGQWSRFVRPGYSRIDAPAQSGSLRVSAFRNASTGNFAIVVINNTAAVATRSIALTGATTQSVTPWITSASQSLQQQSAVSVTNGVFTYGIPAQSIVTFVGGP